MGHGLKVEEGGDDAPLLAEQHVERAARGRRAHDLEPVTSTPLPSWRTDELDAALQAMGWTPPP